jgi:tRNA(Ile2) C34 agmatinyltransferase TiaS
MTGFKVPFVIRDLMWFTGHGYMVNVTLGRNAVRVDLLSNETEFVAVSCPSCGAVVNIRKGGGGRCQHCGTFMRLQEDQNV